MKISFNGNHIFKMPNREKTISAYEIYMQKRQNTGADMIIYADDCFVHVIDGSDVKNFRKAAELNRHFIKEPYLFDSLTAAYRKNATIVDFSDVQDINFMV